MTRPKVDPDKRQRTAQACDSCKRRKQKCNGIKPCATCQKRNLTCTYGTQDNHSDDTLPSPKRRMIESPVNGNSLNDDQQLSPIVDQSPWNPPHAKEPKGFPDTPRTFVGTPGPFPDREVEMKANTSESDVVQVSHSSTTDGQEEEAVVYSNTRMLQDPTGRLLYIGDSATLSFLQLIRMIVDNVAGPSQFTNDPRRHRIVETTVSLPDNIRRTHLLPDRQTASILVDSYFTNVNGLIEVCERKGFMATLEICYTDPLNVDPTWLCQLYLIFAIGLVMACPKPGTPEDIIIQKLRSERIDRAEIFYSDAKNLADPSSGFEDAGFWSIQALTLMAVYMVAISKRNAAYAYYGMAVRSAFALGLHREETMVIFSSTEQSIRRNLWRSLFVLDRFLSASLGRPTAIRESDCSGTTLQTGEKAPFPQAPFPTAANANYTNPSALGLEASVRSCHMIGVILEKVYSKRKISTRMAQEIADHCKGWPKSLDPSLHYRQASSGDPAQGIAILHVNLLHCHSIILLTRPFFLFLMNKAHQQHVDPLSHRHNDKGTSRMVRFAEACVIASNHSIALVQNALEGGYLPHRNPFVLYFLFAASLILLSNEFSALTHNTSAPTSIQNSIHIMHYLSQQDAQGSRLLYILTSFRDVIIRQHGNRASHLVQNLPTFRDNGNGNGHANQGQGEDGDPMVSILTPSAPFSPALRGEGEESMNGSASTQQRHNSHPNFTPLPHHLSTSQPQTHTHPNSSRPHQQSHQPPLIRRTSSHPTPYFSNPSNTTTNNPSRPSTNPQNQNPNQPPPPLQRTSSLASLTSLDAFLDLSRVNSHPSNSGGDVGDRDRDRDGEGSVFDADAEIDFEALWQWPTFSGPGAGIGTGIAFSGPGTGTGAAGDGIGEGGGGVGGGGMGGMVDVQGVSDSSVPLFGVVRGFGGI